jgi:outer membrane protein assembly factor BamB
MGNNGGNFVVTAVSEKDGKSLWSVKIGPAVLENSLMRWLAQAAPTVDGERVYVVPANGDYVCLAVDTGKEIWRKHNQKDFAGSKSIWGFCDYPLVDGDNLILTPGGE